MPRNHSFTDLLCLRCGLCCNGVLFKDVELQPPDDRQRLVAAGLPVRATRSHQPAQKLSQPCAALCGDNRCRIYGERPVRCREFECLQLRGVRAGEIDPAAALRAIARARQRADRVRQLLRRLGDTDEALALSRRFHRLKKRLEREVRNQDTAGEFAALSLAMHELNLLLSTSFYPEPGG